MPEQVYLSSKYDPSFWRRRWPVLEAKEGSAGTIRERYRLRAYDAVHFAASLIVQAQTEETVTFACWDRALAEVAVRAGLQLFPIV